MAKPLIADRVRVGRRYLRAVDVLRDFSDPAALEGYVLTPSVHDALKRLGAGLAKGSTQRAFRVTGPFGAGKSAFALLVARLFAGDPAAVALAARSGVQAEGLPRFEPLLISGRRASLGDELLRVICDHADRAGLTETLAEGRDLAGRRQAGARDSAPLLQLLSRHAERVAAASGAGLLIIIDEMGRFLEFAAANQAMEDPTLFQQLAEKAGGATTAPIAVVGFLHHRFSDYVAGLGDWIEGEWARAAERYEELSFHQSTEQTLFLLAEALVPAGAHERAIVASARKLYDEARDRGLFTSGQAAVREIADRLYPLHPSAVAALSACARRFGQNERSVFSFLQSLEPFGLQRFAHEQAYGPATWLRLHDLWDYLAAREDLGIRARDRARRWDLSLDLVRLNPGLSEADQKTLKTLSVIAVLEPLAGLRGDPEALGWCMGVDAAEAAASLERLKERGAVYRRPSTNDWSLWSNASVDLDSWFDAARRAVPVATGLEHLLSTIPPSRPLVAHRHYHRTGTLRTFAVAVGKAPPADLGGADGLILVVPVMPGSSGGDEQERVEELSRALGPLVLFRLRQITPADLRWAHELDCWRWVADNCAELRMDDLARAEVESRAGRAQAALDAVVAPFASAAHDPRGDIWIHHGEVVELQSRGALSRLLSRICDDMFDKSPILRNELINRAKLSTAIAGARMRLLGLMVTNAADDYLGLVGAPPERTIYLSLFRASGLHRQVGESFQFAPPAKDDPMRWRDVWDRIDELLETGSAIRFDQLLEALGRVPYGLRAGPALLLLTAYLIHHQGDVALLEKNSFQPDITPDHFMRLAKNPGHFALHKAPDGDRRQRLLSALAAKVGIWKTGERPEKTLKSVVGGLYGWWNGLPQYAVETQSISTAAKNVRHALRKATDPIDLLVRGLPEAVGGAGEGDAEELAAAVADALAEIEEAPELLRRRVVAALTAAFGVRSIADLRNIIRIEYSPRALALTGYRLKAFVDRAANGALDEAAWLDSIASLLAGRRLENWSDDTLDSFAFEARSLAQQLKRWLATMLAQDGQARAVTALHLATADGEEIAFYMWEGMPSDRRAALEAEIRALLDGAHEADEILASLLTQSIRARQEKVHS